MAVLVCMFILNFVGYLWNADITYLDLASPQQEALICRKPASPCDESESAAECVLLEFGWYGFAMNLDAALPSDCPVTTLRATKCSSISLPVTSLTGKLGTLITVDRWVNPLEAWSVSFLLLLIWLCGSILLHDLALLQPECRPLILSLSASKRKLPRTWQCLRSMHLCGCMAWLREKHCLAWGLCLPIWMAFNVLTYLTLVFPLIMLLSLLWAGPVRMSRLSVFLSGSYCSLWSLGFFINVCVSQSDSYAVLLDSQKTGPVRCVCHCEYPLQTSITFRLQLLSLAVAVGSFSITFRALKGLRRPQWANLFSVLYSVPIAAFPIVWTRPPEAGGGPIRFRMEGEPVQSEPAFDPFCLMDEQPESGRMKIVLKPAPQSEEEMSLWDAAEEAIEDSMIGCCGFPRKGGFESEVDIEMEPETHIEVDMMGESTPRYPGGDPVSGGENEVIKPEFCVDVISPHSLPRSNVEPVREAPKTPKAIDVSRAEALPMRSAPLSSPSKEELASNDELLRDSRDEKRRSSRAPQGGWLSWMACDLPHQLDATCGLVCGRSALRKTVPEGFVDGNLDDGRGVDSLRSPVHFRSNVPDPFFIGRAQDEEQPRE